MTPVDRQALVARLENRRQRIADGVRPYSVALNVGELDLLLALLRADEAEPPAQHGRVELDRDESGYIACYTTPDGVEMSCGDASATIVGALAHLCVALIEVAEDKVKGGDAHDPENAAKHEPGTPDMTPAPSRPAGGAANCTHEFWLSSRTCVHCRWCPRCGQPHDGDAPCPGLGIASYPTQFSAGGTVVERKD